VVGALLSLVRLRHRELRDAQRELAAREQGVMPVQA
jgi:hypothetical protein